MSRVCHFEIHTDDPARAIAFYQGLFGWSFHKWDGPMPYWLITTGPDTEPGINGGLLQRPCSVPGDGQGLNAFACTVSVENLDASLVKALSTGASLALPKMPVPGVGWLAYIKDTEGNVLGMMQPDPGAK